MMRVACLEPTHVPPTGCLDPVKVEMRSFCMNANDFDQSLGVAGQPLKVALCRRNSYSEATLARLTDERNALLFGVGLQVVRPGVSPVKRSSSPTSVSTEAGSVCDESDVESARPCADCHIGVTLRNIPTAYTRVALVKLLDSHGFFGEYTMVYMPIDRRRKKARGFAFVYFETNKSAARCVQCFEGFKDWGTHSVKVCATEWCKTQGQFHELEGLMLRSIPDDDKPAMYRKGVRVIPDTPGEPGYN